MLLLVGPWLFALGRRYEARVAERDEAAFEAHVASTPVPIFDPRNRVPNPQLTADARLTIAGRAAQLRSLWHSRNADNLPSTADDGVVIDPRWPHE